MELNLKFKDQSRVLNSLEVPSVFIATPLRENITDSRLFNGNVRETLGFRDSLLFLNDVVVSRFYRPDLWRYLDPVITCEEDVIRMECFSSCASVYARVDFDLNLFEDYRHFHKGTTNVNFNSGFINELALLRPGKNISLEIGEESITLQSEGNNVTEHKVKLPDRWIKGFLQVQAINRKTVKYFELGTIASKHFVSQVKSGYSNNNNLFLIPGKGSLEVAAIKPRRGDFLSISGLERVRLLLRLLPHMKTIHIYGVENNEATVWVMQNDYSRVTLGLSGAVNRGFSGEGESLRTAIRENEKYSLEVAAHIVKNLKSFTIEDLASILETERAETVQLIDLLAVNGYLGYDSLKESFFYRVLPFTEKYNSRLENSRVLAETDRITLEEFYLKDGELTVKGFVEGVNATYYSGFVLDKAKELRDGSCTCRWIQKNGFKRGPCKHILALRFLAEEKLSPSL